MTAEQTSPVLPPDGILLVDKPAGRTSHDVVAAVRRTLREQTGLRKVKVGHAGTLDPFATGLLLILLGRATRVQRILMELPKAYEARARLGWTSTTGDTEGEVGEGRMPSLPLVLPTGVLRQRPPAYSAVHVGGERAYAIARRGEEVDVPEREVHVSRYEQSGPISADGEVDLLIECGSGTYVRSLVADLGDAYCTALRRTRIGPFAVVDADPDPARALSLEAALGFLPSVQLDSDAARRASHGTAVDAGPCDAGEPIGWGPDARPQTGFIRLLDEQGIVALAVTDEHGRLKPTVGLRG